MEKRRAILIGLVSLVLLTLAFSVSSVAQAAPAQSPAISVSPASLKASQGDTFTIEIVVDPKGNEICAAQYTLLYSGNNVLNVTSQTQGTFLSQDGAEPIVVANIINNTVGTVKYGENRVGEDLEHGVTTEGILASITFEVIGTSGMCNLKLSDAILINPNLEELKPEITHGTCTVGEVTGEPVVSDITVEEAHQMLEEEPAEIILLDVRTEKEYEERHIPDAISIPLSGLESRIGELDKYKSKKIIVYCLSGSRSKTASETLVQHGFENVYNMLGGLNEWKMYFSVTSSVTPTPALSPSLSPFPAASPEVSPTPTPTTTPAIGGFEAALAIIGLLGISYLFIKKRNGRR